MHYVYLIQSQSAPTQRYIGMTSDLRARIARHNDNEVSHTSKFQPWTLVTYVTFSSRKQAAEFELYLKSGSGRAFANRHLWPATASVKDTAGEATANCGTVQSDSEVAEP